MKIIIVLIALLFVFNPVYGNATSLETPTDVSSSNKENKELSQSSKESKEKKESKGKRQSKSSSTGVDKQTSEAVKAVEQAAQSKGADVALDLQAVFLDRITELENNMEPFMSCKVATYPKLPRDFKINAEVRPGVIDLYKADYYRQAGETNAAVAGIGDEAGIRAYRNCLVSYGAIIAQAYLNLTGDLTSLKAAGEKDEEGNTIIKGMGYDDFVMLSESALQKAVQTIENKTIKRTLDRVVNDNTPCRFEKARELIQCGASQIHLSVKPMLIVSSVMWYGDKFGGFSGSYKVSKGWSLSDALEKLKSTSKYARLANDTSVYAEELESHGKSKEAVEARKKAWEVAKSGKISLSIKKKEDKK